MGIGLVTLILLFGVLLLLFAGVPMAFSTGVTASLLILLELGPGGLSLIATRIYDLMSNFSFVAVPLFVMMGLVLEKSGVTEDLFRAMAAFGGRIRGGLAVQTLLVSVLLATMSGIIGGEIVLLGLIALPEMLKRGYDRRLAIGTICAGGSLGTMIPPSIVLIVYGLATGTGIGDLFLAVLIPGLLLAALYVAYVMILATARPEAVPSSGAGERELSTGEKFLLLRRAVLPVLVAGWVLFCIYTGITSIVEAAAMGVLGATVAAALRGRFSLTLVRDVCGRTLRICGMIMWIVFGATALIGVYNFFGGAAYVSSALEGLDLRPLTVILLMMAVLFVLGMFMDWIGILLLTMPIFVPIVVGFGYDPIWFGVLFTLNMQMSYLTPPFGPAAFYLKGVAPEGITMGDIYSSFLPFILLQALAIGLLIAFPQIALWLPAAVR